MEFLSPRLSISQVFPDKKLFMGRKITKSMQIVTIGRGLRAVLPVIDVIYRHKFILKIIWTKNNYDLFFKLIDKLDLKYSILEEVYEFFSGTRMKT